MADGVRAPRTVVLGASRGPYAPDPRGLGVQELPPCRVGVPFRGRKVCRALDPADRGCADPVAKLEQLALDALVSPCAVLGGELLDVRGDLGADRRSPRMVRISPLLLTRRRCHRRTVPGVTSRCARRLRGSCRISADTARSAQSCRGRGLPRRSTATSCRSTSSSTSLEADERPSRTSQLQSRTKIR
jgi:hypothetical protein